MKNHPPLTLPTIAAEQERRQLQRPLRKGYWPWHYDPGGAQGFCCAAVWSPAADLQPETDIETGNGPHTVEDMLGPGTQEVGTPKSSNDYRPLAVTSHVMKTLERLRLSQTPG